MDCRKQYRKETGKGSPRPHVTKLSNLASSDVPMSKNLWFQVIPVERSVLPDIRAVAFSYYSAMYHGAWKQRPKG